MKERSQQNHDAESGGPLGGERLAAARRAHEISASDIAKELHLDEPKVRALEQNNFEYLGAPVFAKGHLRKYAELVGVPIEDILADYYELNRTTGAPPVVGPVRKFERDLALGRWIGGGVAVIIIASAAYWWFTQDPMQSLTQTAPAILAPFASSTVSEPAQSETVEATGSGSETEAAMVVSEAEPQSEVEPEAQPEAQSQSETELPVDAEALTSPETLVASSEPPVFEADTLFEEASLLPQVQVELSFFGDCWTEVTDASGRRLFYDLGTAGRVVTLSGDEPLQIVLGDSENVSIAVEGQDYPIADYVRVGRLTRLTINSQ
jgi:cytoskeleton protein RodZ